MNRFAKKAFTALIALVMCFGMLQLGTSNVYAAKGEEPGHEKTLTVNADGTYTIALNVKGDSEKKPTKANVIVIFDTSSSMNTDTGNQKETYSPTSSTGGYWYQNNLYGKIGDEYVLLERRDNGWAGYTFWYNGEQYTGQRYRRQTSQTRLQAAEAAVNELAKALLDYNGKEGNPDDTIEMALVDFANEAEIAQAPTTDYATFEATVNTRDAGNNDRGTNWEAGLRSALDVDFGSDEKGQTTYVIFVSDGNPTFYLEDPDNTTRGGTGSETNPATNVATCYNQATPAAKALVDAGYEFYTIGVYGNVDRMEGLTKASGAPEENYYSATDTAALQEALGEILEKIEMAGIGNVAINDGTTQDVKTTSDEISHLLVVDENSYKYYRAGGDDGAGSDKYDSTANNGLGEEWADAPEAKLENAAVKWELDGVLENDVTYTVTFDCWPSQETLDIVAAIKNDPSSYDRLDENIKKYITKDGNLTTNTAANMTYIDTRTGEKGEVNFNELDPVQTTAVEALAVSKKWENKLDKQSAEPVTLTVTRDGDSIDAVDLSDKNEWTASLFVSIGIMRVDDEGKVELLTTGHNFTFVEPEDLGYYWELDVPTVRPMLVNGELKTLIKVDDKHQPKEGATTYTLPEQDSIEGGEYYVDDAETPSLTAVNSRRARLNLTKVVEGEDADPEQTFPFKLNVVNSLADDPQSTDTDSDNYVWFSVWNGEAIDARVTGAEKEMKDGAWTGYYFTKSGTDIELVLKAGDNLRFLNLPTGSTYTFEEGTMPANYSFVKAELTAGVDEEFEGGQTTSGTIAETNIDYTVTFTNSYGLNDVEITKVWEDSKNKDGLRPSAADFKKSLVLKADGTDVTEKNADKLTVTEDKEDNTKYIVKWAGLDRLADGKEIKYTVEEKEIAGYLTSGSPAEDGGTITNVKKEPIKYDPPVIKKVIGDTEKADKNETFTFKFEAVTEGAPMPKGGESGSMTISVKADEEHEFGDMYLEEPGTYKYKITEVNEGKKGYTYDKTEYELVFEIGQDEKGQLTCKLTVNGEAVDHEAQEPYVFEFINEYREYVNVEIEKKWADNENSEKKRPEEISVTLYANDEAVETVKLNQKNEWKITVEGLPFSDEDYKEIKYTAKEDKVPEGYKDTYKVSDYKITVTNTLKTPETGDASNMTLWLLLFGASMTGTLGAAYVSLKKKKEQK